MNQPSAIALYQAAVIESALRMYARTGIKANTAYTPTAMMTTAHAITGQSFKPRAYVEAANALKTWREKWLAS